MARWKPDTEARLIAAAITLFERQGYDATTVEEIANTADLTRRTFFRYFTDKREVLFRGSEELQRRWVEAIAEAPEGAGLLAATAGGFPVLQELFADRLPFAQVRAKIIAAHPELQERELIKLRTLSDGIETALIERGVSASTAELAAQSAVTIFHTAFGRWLTQDDPYALGSILEQTLADLRTVTAAP